MIGKILSKLFLLVMVAMIQIYFFDRLPSLSYVHLSFYLSYVILLSINTHPLFVLLSSALLGVVIDLSTGTGGLVTIAITAAAFTRIRLLKRIVSEDNIKYDFLPSVRDIGAGRWFFYCVTIVLVNGITVVLMESGGLLFVSLAVFLRLLINIVATTFLIYITQLLLNRKPKSSY